MISEQGRRITGLGAALLTAVVHTGCVRSETPEQLTPPEHTPSGDYTASCTGEGEHGVDGPIEQVLDDVPEVDGHVPQVALGYTSDEGPVARIYVSSSGLLDTAVQIDGPVGHVAEAGPWTVTFTSICSQEVRFDVELTDP